MTKNNLHWYINQLRPHEKQWKLDNPGRHPVEMAREMAIEVVNMAKENNIKELYCHPAALSGVVEYGYAICYLEEARISVQISEVLYEE